MRTYVESRREGERAVNLHNQFKTMSLAPRTDRSFFSPRPPVWKKSHSWRYINYGRLSTRARCALVRLSARLVAVATGTLKTSLRFGSLITHRETRKK